MEHPTVQKPDAVGIWLLLAIMLIGNILICARALSEGGWAALGLLLMVAPIFNGIILLMGIFILLYLKRKAPSSDLTKYSITVISLPFLMTAIQLGILFSGVTGGGC